MWTEVRDEKILTQAGGRGEQLLPKQEVEASVSAGGWLEGAGGIG